jgi:hypothetical protein
MVHHSRLIQSGSIWYMLANRTRQLDFAATVNYEVACSAGRSSTSCSSVRTVAANM